MKIFISWSGERSRLIAEALKIWLTDVVSFFEPWVSSEDIERGARWEFHIGNQLKNIEVGIICLTRENLDAPWILYEAGALAKSLDRSRVCPYLFQVNPSELKGPLVQFQATQANEHDTLKLLQSLNNCLGKNKRDTDQIERAFKQWWPELHKKLQNIPSDIADQQKTRSDRDLLEELLDIVRQQVKDRTLIKINKPFDYISLENLFFGEDVEAFARTVTISKSSIDSNSVQWSTANHQKQKPSPIDGTWSSRWNLAGYKDDNVLWQVGIATIVTFQPYVMILHKDDKCEYFMLTKYDKEGRLVGKHYNLYNLTDNSPWVGVIVNNDRIDGQWKHGRWDIQRHRQI